MPTSVLDGLSGHLVTWLSERLGELALGALAPPASLSPGFSLDYRIGREGLTRSTTYNPS